jgi:hypothetical protein
MIPTLRIYKKLSPFHEKKTKGEIKKALAGLLKKSPSSQSE